MKISFEVDKNRSYVGSMLLKFVMYWYLVWQFDVWPLGVLAYALATLLNLVHMAVTQPVETPE